MKRRKKKRKEEEEEQERRERDRGWIESCYRAEGESEASQLIATLSLSLVFSFVVFLNPTSHDVRKTTTQEKVVVVKPHQQSLDTDAVEAVPTYGPIRDSDRENTDGEGMTEKERKKEGEKLRYWCELWIIKMKSREVVSREWLSFSYPLFQWMKWKKEVLYLSPESGSLHKASSSLSILSSLSLSLFFKLYFLNSAHSNRSVRFARSFFLFFRSS